MNAEQDLLLSIHYVCLRYLCALRALVVELSQPLPLFAKPELRNECYVRLTQARSECLATEQAARLALPAAQGRLPFHDERIEEIATQYAPAVTSAVDGVLRMLTNPVPPEDIEDTLIESPVRPETTRGILSNLREDRRLLEDAIRVPSAPRVPPVELSLRDAADLLSALTRTKPDKARVLRERRTLGVLTVENIRRRADELNAKRPNRKPAVNGKGRFTCPACGERTTQRLGRGKECRTCFMRRMGVD